MIDFRYHLVSIVAIFLALTVGIFLGSTVLTDELKQTTEEVSSLLGQNNQELRGERDTLQRREEGNNSFVTASTGQLVRDELAGESVVVFEAPGATASMREAVQKVLVQAGAAVSGRVALTERFVDPKEVGFVERTADTAKPVGMTFADEATPHAKAGAVLASAVVTPDRAQAGKSASDASQVLDTFEKGGLISVTGEPSKRATLAVVISGDPFEGESAEAQNMAIVSTVGALDAGGQGTVVIGTADAAASGGMITALRDTSEVAQRVSSVDTADLPAGRVVVVYALREQLSGAAGQYGLGSDSSGFQPVREPEPTPTPSSTSTSEGS
ncbi:Copper transport outer membrane protein, MctB [Sinosporangium album]|uniref:Copper transport outer membrane protein, MctB n=1 Tax=Sinosporangium album TaxID=504805 RepID=A0A1G7WGP7_9ACTN|nr:copper transporter [Sinosporangium album]SDG71034.1 Copper transport outer membrane protein, MctB [Sinosporangium album]